MNTGSGEVEQGNERIMEETGQVTEDEINEFTSGIFTGLLVGKYKSDTGMNYEFCEDGIYSGFFDDKDKNVSGYTYKICVDAEANTILKIFNLDKDKTVEYILYGNEDGSIELLHSLSGKKILLRS